MKRKELKKIILAGMPEREIDYVKKNLRGSGLRFVILSTTEAQWSSAFAEECQGAADSGIVISGSKEALQKAGDWKIAAIGYQEGMDRLQADMIAEGFEEVDADFFIHVFERYHHIPWKILETERCMLREAEIEDLDSLFVLYSYPGMTDYMEGLYPYEKELEYQKAYIKNVYSFYGYGMWLVFDKTSGNLIGRAGVEYREEVGGLELGYAVGTPFQRQGYAEEVCRAILDYVGKELEFEEVFCLIREGNEASVHLAEKLGFKYQMILVMDGCRMLKYARRLREK